MIHQEILYQYLFEMLYVIHIYNRKIKVKYHNLLHCNICDIQFVTLQKYSMICENMPIQLVFQCIIMARKFEDEPIF